MIAEKMLKKLDYLVVALVVTTGIFCGYFVLIFNSYIHEIYTWEMIIARILLLMAIGGAISIILLGYAHQMNELKSLMK